MSELVNVHSQDKVTTLSLNNGKANAISHQMIDQINQGLDLAEQQENVVVITGSEGMLSGGYDLAVMRESMEAAMKLVERGSTLTRRLLSFPYPVVVACSGHAVAKGAFLLLAADYRIGVEGPYKIGLNEVAIGMTMHHAGVELARGRLAPVFFNRAVVLAEMMSPQEALTAGFLDKVVPGEALAATTSKISQLLSQLNMQAHYQTKLKARADLLAELDQAITLDRTSSL